MNASIAYIHHLPGSLSVISLSLVQTELLFGAILLFSTYYFNRKFTPIMLGLLLVLVVLGLDVRQIYTTMTTDRIIVFAGQRHTHINIIHHRQNKVITSDSVEAEKIGSNYWRKQKLEMPCYFYSKQLKSITFGGKTFLLLDSLILTKRTMDKPLRVDFLVIGNALKPKMDKVFDNIQPRTVIIDKNISKWYASNITEICNKRGVATYHIAERGAFQLPIISHR